MDAALGGHIGKMERGSEMTRTPTTDSYGMARTLALSFVVVALALVGAGCNGSPVGDPCVPENIPTNADGTTGFRASERYLETSSVQCRTRVCLVDGLMGDPTQVDCSGPSCVTSDQLNAHVYCTCRCNGPAGSATFCACPDGYECTQVLESGGTGIVGSYCLKSTAPPM